MSCVKPLSAACYLVLGPQYSNGRGLLASTTSVLSRFFVPGPQGEICQHSCLPFCGNQLFLCLWSGLVWVPALLPVSLDFTLAQEVFLSFSRGLNYFNPPFFQATVIFPMFCKDSSLYRVSLLSSTCLRLSFHMREGLRERSGFAGLF